MHSDMKFKLRTGVGHIKNLTLSPINFSVAVKFLITESLTDGKVTLTTLLSSYSVLIAKCRVDFGYLFFAEHLLT